MARYVATLQVEFNADDQADAENIAESLIDESLDFDYGGLPDGSEVRTDSVEEIDIAAMRGGLIEAGMAEKVAKRLQPSTVRDVYESEGDAAEGLPVDQGGWVRQSADSIEAGQSIDLGDEDRREGEPREVSGTTQSGTTIYLDFNDDDPGASFAMDELVWTRID